MKNIIKDGHVEFKIVDIQFNGVARIVKDEEAFETGKYLKYYGKVSNEIINDWFSELTVIEISKIENG